MPSLTSRWAATIEMPSGHIDEPMRAALRRSRASTRACRPRPFTTTKMHAAAFRADLPCNRCHQASSFLRHSFLVPPSAHHRAKVAITRGAAAGRLLRSKVTIDNTQDDAISRRQLDVGFRHVVAKPCRRHRYAYRHAQMMPTALFSRLYLHSLLELIYF